MKGVILVCGPICSGKSTWCDRNIRSNEDSYIKVSDIVKVLSNASNRFELQDTKVLDKEIGEHLVRTIDRCLEETDVVFIDGIRQLSILEAVKAKFPFAELVWLEVSYEGRETRYNVRNQPRDRGQSFEEANQRDLELGLNEIRKYYYENLKNTNTPL